MDTKCFVPPPVFETNDIDDSDEFSREMLFCDDENEHMLLTITKGKKKFKHTEAPDVRFGVRVNNRHSIKCNTVDKILSNGCVRLIRVYCPTDEHGNKSPLQCEVEIIYREPIERLSLSFEAIRRKDKFVQNALAKAGVTFIDNGFKVWCEKFSEQLNKAKVQTEHTGFYKDENDCWCHVNAGDIAFRAVDSQGTPERLGIDFSTTSDDNFLRLKLFLQGISGGIFTVICSMNVFPMAMLAIVYPERCTALEDLRALYCANDNPPLYPGKFFEKAVLNLRDEVALISLSESDYMNKKCLEMLSQHGSELTAVPLLLSESEKVFSKRNDILELNYDLTGIGDINGELCWAVKTVLNEPRLSRVLPDKFKWWCTLLENDTETVGMRNLIALLLSLVQLYLPRLGENGEELNAVLQQYKDYLVSSAYSSSQTVIDRLKMFLTSRRDIPLIRNNSKANQSNHAIILKENMVLFSHAVLDYTAKKCGTTSMALKSILINNGVLLGNINQKNMRNIREVSVEKFFEILCAYLDEEQTDIADTAMELMLEQVYESYDEILNSFSELVENEDGADELINAARKAADQLSGFSWDKAVVGGKISQVIAQSSKEADALLLEFFNYKAKQNETHYTLLLLDEVQDFSWDGKLPLVSKILRQGRKFGIVGVFSTQYLNANNGKNIASALEQIGTHFVFRPSGDIATLNQLGYQSSDDKVRDALKFLDTGEALASGNISTDICPLDYPVKFTVNQDDLNDIL